MGKYKEKPKYNVLSVRISDDEKDALNEMMRHTRKSTAMLVREAINRYASSLAVSAPGG